MCNFYSAYCFSVSEPSKTSYPVETQPDDFIIKISKRCVWRIIIGIFPYEGDLYL